MDGPAPVVPDVINYDWKRRGEFTDEGIASYSLECSLGQVIGRTASRFPDQPAIVSTNFAPLTYRDLQR
ncbi:hypothetical protein, partial [Bradyrhizobium sp. AUGA SZCCT0169]|uniref:hypothetical protein n=1 Tax=Bradyrhizobium sp. AUGA SZCCT0169 TaxID=2807663 RepID=UPI001BAD6744